MKERVCRKDRDTQWFYYKRECLRVCVCVCVCVCVRVNRRGWRKQRNLFCSSVSENDRESSEQERSRYFCLIRVTVRKHCHTLCSRLSRCRGEVGKIPP